MIKKTIALLMCLCFAVGTLAADAKELIWPPNREWQNRAVNAETQGIDLTCKAAVLYSADTGKILYTKNESERLPEASITKVMTLLLVFEALDSGRIKYDDVITCSEHAASMGGSQIWLEAGEQMTVDQLIKAAAVGSANDASVALAEHVAGTHEKFVMMMNERAGQLGMRDTAYKNCTGLDAEGHITSAIDIAIASAELLKHQKVLEYTGIWMDSLRNGELQLANTNKMLRTYEGCNGLKTGTTSRAGCCISASATRDGMTLIAVVLGGSDSKTRFGEAAKLLDFGFAGYEVIDLDTVPVSTVDIPISGGMRQKLGTYANMGGKLIIPKGRANDIRVEVNMPESIEAPISDDQIVGTVSLSVDGMLLGDYNIMAFDGCEAVTFGNVLGEVLRALLRV